MCHRWVAAYVVAPERVVRVPLNNGSNAINAFDLLVNRRILFSFECTFGALTVPSGLYGLEWI